MSNATRNLTPADIVMQVLQSRRTVPQVQGGALTKPDGRQLSALDELRSQSANSARPGLLRRVRNTRYLQEALTKVDNEVIDAEVDVYKLERLSRADAVRDRLTHNFLLAKAQHGEQALAAAQLLDERFLHLLEAGEDRLNQLCSTRVAALNEQFERGILTLESYQTAVMNCLQRYEALASRLEQGVIASRSTSDAMVARAIPQQR